MQRIQCAILLSLVWVVPSWAAMFVNNFGAGMAGNAAAQAAILRAQATWSSVLLDDISVVIDSDFSNLGSGGIIGSTSSTLLIGGYTTVRNAMAADMLGTPEQALGAALPTTAQFLGTIPSGFTFSGQMLLTQANAKALGFAGFGGSDGSMLFNTQFGFDFDNSDGVTAGTIDYETVVLHELGHALGFISAVDEIDYYRSQGQAAAIAFTTLDMYRFAAANAPGTLAEFTNTPRNFVPGANNVFSDTENTWALSTGVSLGDGRQASHWKDDALTGIHIGAMDPTLSFGATSGLTDADVRAMNLIGWNVASVAAVPEPSTFAMMGLGAICLYAQRGRVKRRSS